MSKQGGLFEGASKKIVASVAALAIAACGFCTLNMAVTTNVAQAETPSATKVNAVYKNKAKKLKAQSRMNEFYSWSADLDGNGVKEMLCMYKTGLGGLNFDIYTYKSGAAKSMLATFENGWKKIQYSRASNTLCVYALENGVESYSYSESSESCGSR